MADGSRRIDEMAHVVVIILNIEFIVHLVDDDLDPAFHLASAVDNSTSPVPSLEHPKDVLDGVQFPGVGRQEDVVDVVVAKECCCDSRVMDPGVVHHKADFSILESRTVVDKRLKEGDKAGCFERSLFHRVEDDALG